ncbi:hypothetical protein BKA93DRAFT_571946 [Sparassis latifolia]
MLSTFYREMQAASAAVTPVDFCVWCSLAVKFLLSYRYDLICIESMTWHIVVYAVPQRNRVARYLTRRVVIGVPPALPLPLIITCTPASLSLLTTLFPFPSLLHSRTCSCAMSGKSSSELSQLDQVLVPGLAHDVFDGRAATFRPCKAADFLGE